MTENRSTLKNNQITYNPSLKTGVSRYCWVHSFVNEVSAFIHGKVSRTAGISDPGTAGDNGTVVYTPDHVAFALTGAIRTLLRFNIRGRGRSPRTRGLSMKRVPLRRSGQRLPIRRMPPRPRRTYQPNLD